MAEFYLRCDSFQCSKIFELTVKRDLEASSEEFKNTMIKLDFCTPKTYVARYESYLRSYFESILPVEMMSVQWQLVNFRPDFTPKLLTIKGREIADHIKHVIQFSAMTNAVLCRFSRMFQTGMLVHRILIYTTRGFVDNRYNLVSSLLIISYQTFYFSLSLFSFEYLCNFL